MRLTRESGAHVRTQTGTYATAAVVPLTQSDCFALPLLRLFQAIRLLCSVSVSPHNSPHPSRSETRSIAAGFPLIRLSDAHKWSYCLCNDRLIGSFGCLFCYCPLIGTLGVLTVYRQQKRREMIVRKKGGGKSRFKVEGGCVPGRERQMED